MHWGVDAVAGVVRRHLTDRRGEQAVLCDDVADSALHGMEELLLKPVSGWRATFPQ